MLILIVIVSLILGLICLAKSEDGYETYEVFAFLLGCVFALSGLILVIMLLFYPYKVSEKIEMYQQENIVIEEKVKNTVRAYMEFEQETYEKILENADLTTMILKYPELNSNELIKVEIETYKENSKKIKELKNDEIGKSTMAWWLYFGH